MSVGPASFRAARPPIRALFIPLLALALAALAAVNHVSAQDSPRLLSMAVSVMPEYDQPSVFVSYRGELNEDVSLPVKMRVRIPADATVDHACSMKPDNEHICHPFTTEPDGDYLALSYEATTPIIYLEYHYGSVSGAGERDLNFDFWTPFAVQDVDLFVQEPPEASGFTLTPAAADVLGSDEFRHHSYRFQSLTPESPVSIAVKYSRPTDAPFATRTEEMAAEPEAATSGGGISQRLLVVLALAGAAALSLVVYLTLSRRARLRFALLSKSPPAETVGPPPAAPATPPASSCRRCGSRLRSGATFCTTCGEAAAAPGGGPG